jgi:hypothetical protein
MIEYEYIDRSTSPPGNWNIKVPQTGVVFNHYDYRSICNLYKSHCAANGIFLTPTWEDEFISEMCKQNTKWGRLCGRISMKKIHRRRLSLTSVLSFLNMMKAWAQSTLSGKSAFVTQAEAEERASVCADCPMNVTLQFSCGACMGAVMTLMSSIIGNKKTERDKDLGACLVCSCSLKTAVHVPVDVQREGLTDEIKEDFDKIEHCWKRIKK